MITEQLYKVACIALVIALIGASVAAGIYHSQLSDVRDDNTRLVTRVGTLTANINTQNEAVKGMKARTDKYAIDLAEAAKLNKETEDKLSKVQYKLKQATLPATCDGKLEFLKQGLIEMSL